MRPDPRELRRIQWLPPLRLQLYLGAPPGSMSDEHRVELAHAHARRRLGLGVLVGVAISALVAGSSFTGAAASAVGTASGSGRVGLHVGTQAAAVPLGYPWAMVPDNGGKGRGTLPGVATTTVPGSEVSDLGMPDVALDAYRSAAQNMAEADPDCRIDWSLIAGIGRVETDHGRYGGRQPAADGAVQPPILGIALDGRPGVALILDTDDGRLDLDTTYDRAVGPMQFIPGTWSAFPDADGDGNGVVDPHNLYDAALAAASYLCSGPGDLSEDAGQRSAVFRYNHADSYVDLVMFYAQAYARGVQPSGPPPQPSGPPPAVPTDPVTDPAHPGDPLPGATPPTTMPPPTTRPPTTAPTTTAPTTTAPTTPPTTTPTTTPPTTTPSSTTTGPSTTTAPPTTTDPTGTTDPGGSTGSSGSTGATDSSPASGTTEPTTGTTQTSGTDGTPTATA